MIVSPVAPEPSTPPPDIDCSRPEIAGQKNLRVIGPDVHRLSHG